MGTPENAATHIYVEERYGETEVFNNVFHQDMCGSLANSVRFMTSRTLCNVHCITYCQIESPETWRKMKLLMTLAVGGRLVVPPYLTNLCNHGRCIDTYLPILPKQDRCLSCSGNTRHCLLWLLLIFTVATLC